MRIGSLRLSTVCAVVLAVALVAPAAALTARSAQSERGVVQSVNASQIVLRALDGSTVSLRMLPGTRVRVNGAKASVGDITPGAVAEVTTDRKGHAVLIRVFSAQSSAAPAATVTESGTVTQVTRSSLSYATADGNTHTVTLDANTRVRQGGGSKRSALRPGATVQVTRTGDTATAVDVLNRGA